MQTLCTRCGRGPATSVLRDGPVCQACITLQEGQFSPELPTLNSLVVFGDIRKCRQCNRELPKTQVICDQCKYTELQLVDYEVQVEKAIPVQVVTESEECPPSGSCWTCPQCSYEYNQEKTCLKCHDRKLEPLGSAQAGKTSDVRDDKQLKSSKFVQRTPTPSKVHESDSLSRSDIGPRNIYPELSLRSQPPIIAPSEESKSLSWDCNCGKKNPITELYCLSCGLSYEKGVASSWMCINCKQNCDQSHCPNCRLEKGWVNYLAHKKVQLNKEKWLWKCEVCFTWTRIDIDTCICGKPNEAICRGLRTR